MKRTISRPTCIAVALAIATTAAACSADTGVSESSSTDGPAGTSAPVTSEAQSGSTVLLSSTVGPATTDGDTETTTTVESESGVAGAPANISIGACLPTGIEDVERPFFPAEVVECDESHLAEIVGITALEASTGFPGVGNVNVQADRDCLASFADHVGVEFRRSPLRMIPVLPTEQSFERGDRAIVCVVVFEDAASTPIGDFDSDAVELPDGQVYSSLLRPGDCFAADASLQQSVVPVIECSEEHRFELYGSIDLPDGDFPTIETLDALADGACFEEFERYTGSVFADAGILYQFFYPSEDSWAGGDRQVLCFLDATEDVTESLAAE